MNDDQIADYVAKHAPALDPKQVAEFVAEHEKPDYEPGSAVDWAVRVLQQRHEHDVDDRLSVDRVAEELRRRGR